MVVIVNYGNADVKGLVEIINKEGFHVTVSEERAVIEKSQCLILANGKSYQEGMAQLRDWELISTIKSVAREGKPILGIGLGMHLLFEGTTVAGFTSGLELLEGLSEALPADSEYPLPHQGERTLIGVDEENPLTKGLTDQLVSYDHSLTVDCDLEQIKALSQYSLKFPAIIQEGAIVGFQFLPELSSGGQQALQNFLRLERGEGISSDGISD